MAKFKVEYIVREVWLMEIDAPNEQLAKKFAKVQLNEGYFKEEEHEYRAWSIGTVDVVEKLG